MHFASLLLHASCALAAPTFLQQRGANSTGNSTFPVVTIKDGTLIGITNSTTKVDAFRGIPFAQPPTGTLRLAPPQAISAPYGTITAQSLAKSCPQQTSSLNPADLPSAFVTELQSNTTLKDVFGLTESKSDTSQGEDCLTIDVLRPEGTTSSSALPVIFWIFGGSFETGNTQSFDGTPLINASRTLGHDVIFVEANYRLSAFGFLSGSEMSAAGATNLGLRDQRLALEWVHDNIAAFGGDPNRVTLFGESAGAKSAFDHLLINGGDNSYGSGNLFHGAIMNSGSAFPSANATSAGAQAVYDEVVDKTGCTGAADTLVCLREAPYDVFLNASSALASDLSYSSMDLVYPPRPDSASEFYSTNPYQAMANGAFAKVPIINGNQQDEGTLFALFQKNITTTAEIEAYFQGWYPEASPALIAQLVATYPDDLAAGSPFHTGKTNNLYPQFKRMAAIIGDVIYLLARRITLTAIAPSLPAVYSYHAGYFHGIPALGTFHGTDKVVIFYGEEALTRNAIYQYYISFFNYLDPNKLNPEVEWPLYTVDSMQLLAFEGNRTYVQPDNFRQSSYEVLSENRFAFTLK